MRMRSTIKSADRLGTLPYNLCAIPTSDHLVKSLVEMGGSNAKLQDLHKAVIEVSLYYTATYFSVHASFLLPSYAFRSCMVRHTPVR